MTVQTYQLLRDDGTPVSRKELARAIWMGTGSQSNARLSDSLLGDILEIALDDFAAIYRSARGYEIDPIYVKALRHDVLIAVEAAALASPFPPQQGA